MRKPIEWKPGTVLIKLQMWTSKGALLDYTLPSLDEVWVQKTIDFAKEAWDACNETLSDKKRVLAKSLKGGKQCKTKTC